MVALSWEGSEAGEQGEMVTLQAKQAAMRRRNQLRRGLPVEEIIVEPPKKVTVYALCHPQDGGVLYIGATTDVARRYKEHLKGSHAGSHAAVEIQKALQELRAAHQRPIIKVLETGTDPAMEAKWIGTALGIGSDLANSNWSGAGRRRNFAPNLTKALSRLGG
jgi:hypothetical protein